MLSGEGSMSAERELTEESEAFSVMFLSRRKEEGCVVYATAVTEERGVK
jgi:hypothetical protein